MIWLWIGFLVFVVAMLALDLGVFHRKAHVVSVREALSWSAVWIALALLFGIFIYFGYKHHWLGLGDYSEARLDQAGYLLPRTGFDAAVKYYTGYVIEKSLSVDNIFVISLIFGFFKIPAKYQHRVLFWGILGALVMRGVFIGLGAALIEWFHPILYVFGVFLLWTAYKMLTADEDPDPNDNWLVKYVHRHFPVTKHFHGQRFAVRESELSPAEQAERVNPGREDVDMTVTEIIDEGDDGRGVVEEGDPLPAEPPVGDEKQTARLPADATATSDVVPVETAPAQASGGLVFTPLALALIVVEGTDLVFAVDSIPAIFAITTDAFIVFTSNIFAVLGLRALYFALAGILDKFYYLKTSLAVILGLIGMKMLLADVLKQNEFLKYNLSFVTLGMITLILGAGIVASLIRARRIDLQSDQPPPT